MTAATDAGLDFWLEYVAAEGGLHERAGESTLVVLPEALQERHGQAIEMTVTTDPDVAREERATLMTVGHPLLTAAAETVLGDGDVGAVRLARPSSRTPDLEQLQAWARDRITVEHGRVDLTGGPRPSVRYLVRVSALVTFTMSSDDRFQEQIECWVDLPSALPLGDGAGELSALIGVEHTERDQPTLDGPGLDRALAAVDAEIARRAERRRRILGDGVRPALEAETDRAREYYGQMAVSLRKRMAAAAPDKVAGYRSRLEHCDAERDRRLAEIEEKYRSSATSMPFRLHLVGVPALTVEGGVRRGNRWYPLDLEWLTPVRRFAPVACPGCGSDEPLVAGKDGLGCRRCRPPRALASVPAGSVPDDSGAGTPGASTSTPSGSGSGGPKASASGGPKASTGGSGPLDGGRSRASTPDGTRFPAGKAAGPATPTPDRAKVRPPKQPRVRPAKEPSPAAMTRTGSKMVMRLWERVEGGDRSVAGMLAADGPAAALARVYGPDGPRIAVGVARPVRLVTVASSPSVAVPAAGRWLTTGTLGASDRVDHPFQVVWRLVGGRPLIDEILPVANGFWPWLAGYALGLGSRQDRWGAMSTAQEAAAIKGDPVAGRILDTTVQGRGIAIAARCLAAWWRLDPGVAGSLAEQAGPEAVAAALDKLVSWRATTYRRSDADAAADYGADPDAVKSMAGRLQRRLALGPTQPW